MKNTNVNTGRKLATGTGLALLCLLGTSLPGQSQGQGQESTIDDTRSALSEWVELRRTISQERRDWAIGKELLTERIAIVQEQIDEMQMNIDKAKARVVAADEESEKLQAKFDRLEAASGTYREVLAGLEARTAELIARLPDPLKETVEPLRQRLPEDPATDEQSVSNRFLTVVGVLNAADKFNRDVTVTSEVRDLGTGGKAEVTALYVGLGQAFYVTQNAENAGLGLSTESGWTWTPENSAGPAIKRAIGILASEEPASFVRVPVRFD